VKDAIIEIIKWIRESIRPVVVLLILSGLVLFFPKSWAFAIGLGAGFLKYRLAAFLCFAGASVWLLTFPVEREYRSRERVKHLHQLTERERVCLRPYIENSKRTQYFGITHIADARSLAGIGVLSETSTVDSSSGVICFEISSWAYSYLRKNRNLVGLS